MRVLVVNAGSSSLKLRLLGDGDEPLGARDLEPAEDIGAALAELGEFDAVGHRVVHGGARFVDPVVIDDGVVAALEELTALAPLHQPPALAAIAAVRRAAPALPAVACFDTAFHAGLPDAAATYALPRAWRERWPLRRYGFHGLSHAWVARRAADLLGGAERIVSCHLGAGASLAAIRDGRSVDTTMGFTPLAGLVMATRPGDVDPGLLLWLLERPELDHDEVADRARTRLGPPGARRNGRHARGDRGRRAPRAGLPSSPSTSTCTACGARSPPWRPRSTGSTRSCSRAGSVSERPRCAPARRLASASSGSHSTPLRTPPRPPTPRSARPERRCARSSWSPARTSRSRAGCGAALA